MVLDSQQLPTIQGESLTVEQALANLRQTEDPSLRYYAAWWIGRFRVNLPEAIDALVDCLADETDRAPDGGYPLRRNAARALGKLGETRVVPVLIDCLACEDYYLREAAAQAIEMLGDSRAVPALKSLLAGGIEAATQVPGKPHLTQPYNAVLEALGRLADHEVVPFVEPFLHHDVSQVQNAAARAMYQLTGDNAYADQLVERLYSQNLQLRRSALMDLGAIGYLPAAHPISTALAENSLKLIALQGVIETHLQETNFAKNGLSAESRQVLTLMDNLL